jgi:hypothetical protein
MLPSGEQEDLAVGFREHGQRRHHGAARRGHGRGGELGGELSAQPLRQSLAAALRATLIGQRPPRNAVQPQASLVPGWDVCQPPPGDQERVGNHVRRVRGVNAAPHRVREHRPAVFGIQPAKPGLGFWPLRGGCSPSDPHSPSCPAPASPLQTGLRPDHRIGVTTGPHLTHSALQLSGSTWTTSLRPQLAQ